MERKQNWQQIEKLLNENGITKLYHFTDKRNIESIIRNGGLYSWGDCVDHNINVPYPGGSTESHSLDYYQNRQYYVRLSFVQNHPMKYIAMHDERQLQPILLEISPEVLFWKHTKFSDQNAVKNDVCISSDADDFGKLIHFNAIKATNTYDLIDDERPYFQAEVLVQHCIPSNYILNIEEIKQQYFPSWEGLKRPMSSHKINILQDIAGLNNFIAQYILGRSYHTGDGVSKNIDMALEYFLQSAKNGFSKAFCPLGNIYKERKEYENALYWFQKAADNNIAKAYFRLAAIQIEKIATQDAINKGYKNLQKGVECGDPACAFILGKEYIDGNTWGGGNIISVDKKKGIELIRQAADSGHLKARKYLGKYYRTEGDEWAALKYYKLAADQGDKDALFYAGYFSNKRGKYADAVKYYEMAVAQNNISAMNNLAICYEHGQGIDVNKEEAFKLYKRAAELGNDVAQNNLAVCYENGTGTDIDMNASLEWRQKAAENKNLSAMRKLAYLYSEGDKVKKDIEKARLWYVQLAEIGTPEDIYDTSHFFKEIDDVDNYQKYLSLAAEKDYVKALIELEDYDIISTAKESSRSDIDEDGVTYSSDYAYIKDCDDKTKVVDIYDGTLIIADEAFKSCEHLTKIVIPQSVKVIGKRSFLACDKLTSIICESDRFIIQNGCLLSADKKRLLTYFGNTDNVILPEGITVIDDGAFFRKNIKTIVFPKSLKVIGEGAFACCSKLIMVYMQNNVIKIGKFSFEECKRLKNITFSTKLKVISEYAFRYSGVEELVLPDNINTIEKSAFYGCEKLKTVDLGKGIKTLGYSAFDNCIKLASIRLSNKLNSIGSFALFTAKNIIVNDNKSYFSDGHAFYRKTPNGVVLCRYLASDTTINITLPIVGVDDYAFYNIPAERILLPSTVKEIGTFCFAKCTNLDHITLPDSLTSIPKGCFEECNKLRHVIIPKNVDNIDNWSSLGYSKRFTRHCVFLNDNVELSYAKLDENGSITLSDITASGSTFKSTTYPYRLMGTSSPMASEDYQIRSIQMIPMLNVVLHIHSNTKNRINDDLINQVKDIIEFD